MTSRTAGSRSCGPSIFAWSLRVALTGALAILGGCNSVDTTNGAGAPPVYRVYFLGGQSNMEGFGFTAELSDQDRRAVEGVMIYNGRVVEDGQDGGGVGIWAPLEPGYGTGFSTDGTSNALSNRFGPELAFGRHLSEREPGANIAVIKYARGGSALLDGVSGYGSWDPEYDTGNRRNQYDNALTAIQTALSVRDIDGDGRPDRLVPAGIIWMQGEADAYDNADAAANYDRNLARLIALLRIELGDENLPVVIGRISDSGSTPETRVMRYSPDVQDAQLRFVQQDRCAAIVTVTEDFQFLSDGWHYRSQEYVRLGNAFADTVRQLEERCGRTE